MNYKIVSSVTQLTRRAIYTFSKSKKTLTKTPLTNLIEKKVEFSHLKVNNLNINHTLRNRKRLSRGFRS